MWKTKRKLKLREKKSFRRLIVPAVVFFILSLSLLALYLWRQVLFEKAYISPLPAVLASQSMSQEQKNAQRELLRLLERKKYTFTSFTPSYESFTLVLHTGEVVIFSAKKPFDAQISSLQLILKSLTIEGKGIKRVDLRFDKPTVILQ